jgi:hypothetical protein
MNRSRKVTLSLFAALAILAVARAALADDIYIPLVFNDPTSTITATQTPLPTPSPTPAPMVSIIQIDNSADGNDLLIERVELRNETRSAIEMEGWTLRSEKGIVYVFPEFSFKIGASVNVWSMSNPDTQTDLYWNRTEPVWNNFHDCAYLRDPERKLVDKSCY